MVLYKIIDKNSNIYIGLTARKLSTRLIEHKSQKKINIDFNSARIIKIKSNSNLDEESLYIKKYRESKKFNCVNVCSYGFSGAGVVFTEERRNLYRNLMTLKNSKKSFKQKMNKVYSKTFRNSKFQKELSNRSHAKKISKMREFFVKDLKNGEVSGPYKGYSKAKEKYGVWSSTIKKQLDSGRPGKNLHFFYQGGN